MKRTFLSAICLSFVAGLGLSQTVENNETASEPSGLPESVETASLTLVSDTEYELSGTLHFYKPKGDDYKNGVGAELQFRRWVNNKFGFAVAAGAAKWKVEEGYFIDKTSSRLEYAGVDGDITIFPVGGSALYKPVDDGKIRVLIEAGVRYVVVDSSYSLWAGIETRRDSVYIEDDFDIKDGVIGLLGANIEAEVAHNLWIVCGAGYQFDLVKGDMKWFGENAGKHRLKSIAGKVGLSLQF